MNISVGNNLRNTGKVSFLFSTYSSNPKPAVLVLETLDAYLYLFYPFITVAQVINRYEIFSIFSECNLLKQRWRKFRIYWEKTLRDRYRHACTDPGQRTGWDEGSSGGLGCLNQADLTALPDLRLLYLPACHIRGLLEVEDCQVESF